MTHDPKSQFFWTIIGRGWHAESNMKMKSSEEVSKTLPNIVTVLDLKDEADAISAQDLEPVLEDCFNPFVKHEAFEINEIIEEAELIVPDLLQHKDQPEDFYKLFVQPTFQNDSDIIQEPELILPDLPEYSKTSDPDFIPYKDSSDENDVSDNVELPLKPMPEPDHFYSERVKIPCKYKCNYKCFHCNTRVQTEAQLDSHYRKAHLKDPKPYKCDAEECSKEFTRACYLRKHKSTSHAPVVITVDCPYCEKKFPSGSGIRQKLIAHIRYLHPGSVKYSCRICNNISFLENDFKDHEKRHEQDSYVCVVVVGNCHKRNLKLKTRKDYGSLDALRRHVSEDHEIYKCKLCKKYSQDEVRLRIHQLKHIKEKKPRPPRMRRKLCQKQVRQSSSLNLIKAERVKRVVHLNPKKQKINKCHLCPKAFASTAFLKSHIKVVHVTLRK